MNNIEVKNQQRKYKVDQGLIKDKAIAILSLCGLDDVELSILIVNNQRIKILNKQYRGIDNPTDVLAFPMQENASPESTKNPRILKIPLNPLLLKGEIGGLKGVGDTQPRLLGDIALSMEKIHSQAIEQGHSSAHEFMVLLTHGILHLLGYDHERSRQEELKMKKRENFILSKLGFTI